MRTSIQSVEQNALKLRKKLLDQVHSVEIVNYIKLLKVPKETCSLGRSEILPIRKKGYKKNIIGHAGF